MDRVQCFSKLPSGCEVQPWLRRTTSVELAQGSVINLVPPGSLLIQSRSHCFPQCVDLGISLLQLEFNFAHHCVLLVTVMGRSQPGGEKARLSHGLQNVTGKPALNPPIVIDPQRKLLSVGVTEDVWAA